MPAQEHEDYPERESRDLRIEKWSLFERLWKWVGREVNKTNTLKGWTQRERSTGEMIALIHSELSECLEYFRHDNPPSDHIPDFSGAEEELADVIIRIMDLAWHKKLNIPRALCAKMEFNKTRTYMHGGKKF